MIYCTLVQLYNKKVVLALANIMLLELLFFHVPGMRPLSLFLVSFMRCFLGKVKNS